MTDKKPKELRISAEPLQLRNAEATQENSEMLIEGYPIVFEKEVKLWDCEKNEWYMESISRNAFDNCDMSDVCGKYNHNDNVLIIARTRNKSLELEIKDYGMFTRWHLCNTTTNRDIYEMVRTQLLCEGSFAFYIRNYDEWRDADGMLHRRITDIETLTDVALCPNGAYGELTNLYAARSYGWLDSHSISKVDTLNKCEVLRLKIKNKIKFLEAKNGKH
jgi:HK97 family phage prohead protease